MYKYTKQVAALERELLENNTEAKAILAEIQDLEFECDLCNEQDQLDDISDKMDTLLDEYHDILDEIEEIKQEIVAMEGGHQEYGRNEELY